MSDTEFFFVLENVNSFSYQIDIDNPSATVEAVGKLFSSALSGKPMEEVKMQATYPLTFLQAVRIQFFMRYGIFLERPYISIA